MNNNKLKINLQIFLDKSKNIKNNEWLSSSKTIALILEKLCNESLITNEFLDSITYEDINLASDMLNDDNNLIIKEIQKNTFLETIISKTNCLRTTDSLDFF